MLENVCQRKHTLLYIKGIKQNQNKPMETTHRVSKSINSYRQTDKTNIQTKQADRQSREILYRRKAQPTFENLEKPDWSRKG